MTHQRNELLATLSTVIANANDTDKARLAQALENYAHTFSRSYRDLTKGGLMRDLLDCIEENSDARIVR